MTDETNLCEYPATNGPCQNPETGEDGYCWLESHSDDGTERESDGRGAPEGNANAAKHMAFSDHFRSDLTEGEEKAIDGLISHLRDTDDPERALAAEIAAEALMKYKRACDERLLREARQWMSEFNLLPNADRAELEHSGEVDGFEFVINPGEDE